MTYTTITAGQEYLLTIHVDEEYLKDEKTVYPIRIDPTIEISYDNNGAGAIQDVTICSSTTQSGSSGSLYIGKRSGYGTCRVLMKFPTLDLSNISSSGNIVSAHVELRDLMCETTAATIQCYMYNGVAWSESIANWSNVSPNSYTTLLSSNSVSYANGKKQTTVHRYKFDIKQAVKSWKSNTATQAKGIMFKADSSVENGSVYNYKTFASYNRASYKPSLSITYNGFDGAETITEDEVKSVQINYKEEQKYFRFVPKSTGFYNFTSSDYQSVNPRGALYNVDKKKLASNENMTGDRNFGITYHCVVGKVYYLEVGCSVTETGSFSVQINKAKKDVSGYASDISGTYTKRVICNYKHKATCYKFVPKITNDFIFCSSELTGDARIWLYDANMQLIDSDDNSTINDNFYMQTKLTSGETYYIVVDQTGVNVGEYKFDILQPTDQIKGICYIKNKGNLQYVDIEGPGTQEWVHQWKAHTDMQEKWLFEMQGDGYYTIRSEYGNKYYIGVENTDAKTDNIKLYKTVSDNTKWKIFKFSTGEVVLQPKKDKEKVLCAPNDNVGAQLQLNKMGSVSNRYIWDVQAKGTYISIANNYFDDGYSVYYEETRAESIKNINSSMELVCDEFFEKYNLRILYDSATYYESPIDICKGETTSNNIDTLCQHEEDHTYIGNITETFTSKYPGDGKHTNIYWSGHFITSIKDNDEENTNRSCSKDNAVYILERYGAERKSSIKWLLTHELYHQFGVKDHYHELVNGVCKNKDRCTECNKNGRDKECIMYELMYSELCEACENDFISHLKSHHKH